STSLTVFWPSDIESSLMRCHELASLLVRDSMDILGLDMNESALTKSQARWQKRNGAEFESSSTSGNHSGSPDVLPTSTQSGRRRTGRDQPLTPNPATGSRADSLGEAIGKDLTVVEPVVILLMAGAIFAIVLLFLQGLCSRPCSCGSQTANS